MDASFPRFFKAFGKEETCRQFLERVTWPDGRYCPHCGSLKSWPIRENEETKVRTGLYECGDCHGQFTVTTKTPLHATKLPLQKWLLCMWIMLTSSKGASSRVTAKWIGVSQKTAWKMCHAVRELLHAHEGLQPALTGIVEVDETYLGGAPRYRRGVKNKRGKGTKKHMVAIAVGRGTSSARCMLVESDGVKDLKPFVERNIAGSAILMSDGGPAYKTIGKAFSAHHSVNHSKKIFVQGDAHCNSAESFGSQLERTLVGVYHYMSVQQLRRYLAEATFRFNAKTEKESKDGDPTGEFVPLDSDEMLEIVFCNAVGLQLRGTTVGGIRLMNEPDQVVPRRPGFRKRWMERHMMKMGSVSP